MTAGAHAAAFDGPGGEDIAGAVARYRERETVAAVEAFDDWQRDGAGMRHAHTMGIASDDPRRRVMAIAYAVGASGTPQREVRGYGRSTHEAIEAMAVEGVKKGMW